MKKHELLTLVCFLVVTPFLLGQTGKSADSTKTVTTPAPTPEEARKHFVMGTTLFKDAKTAADLSQVESEFKQAADLAPQWPDARYNSALAKEAGGDYSGAMADLKLYQQFKLSESEARTVQDKIYALEAKAEVAAKKQAADQQAAAAEEAKAKRPSPAKQVPESFRAQSTNLVCAYETSNRSDFSVTFDESEGTAAWGNEAASPAIFTDSKITWESTVPRDQPLSVRTQSKDWRLT